MALGLGTLTSPQRRSHGALGSIMIVGGGIRQVGISSARIVAGSCTRTSILADPEVRSSVPWPIKVALNFLKVYLKCRQLAPGTGVTVQPTLSVSA
jgi:hypothetical protein